jgi:hypothetical protein
MSDNRLHIEDQGYIKLVDYGMLDLILDTFMKYFLKDIAPDQNSKSGEVSP